jgi:hypothetical protein
LTELSLTLPPRVLFPLPPLVTVPVSPRSSTGTIVIAPILIALLIIPAALVFRPSLLPLPPLLVILPII